MQVALKIVLLTSALVVGCWARDYPVPKTRALIDALTAACYSPQAAREIHYDIIQEALNELLSIPREARDQLGTSQEGQLLLDFVIMPVDTHSVALESDEEKEEYTRQAVSNFITFRPAYIERKLFDGELPMPRAPKTERLIQVIAQSGQLRTTALRSLKTEMDQIWQTLNEMRQRQQLIHNLDQVKGIWNYFNSPVVILVGDYVLPFLESDNLEVKIYRLLRWVFSKRRRGLSRGASSSSYGAYFGGQFIYNSVGIPAHSASKRLVDMVNAGHQPTLADMIASKNEIDRYLDLQARRTRSPYYHSELIEIRSYINHPTIDFLLYEVMPLMQPTLMGPRLSRLIRFLLNLENRSMPTIFGRS